MYSFVIPCVISVSAAGLVYGRTGQLMVESPSMQLYGRTDDIPRHRFATQTRLHAVKAMLDGSSPLRYTLTHSTLINTV